MRLRELVEEAEQGGELGAGLEARETHRSPAGEVVAAEIDLGRPGHRLEREQRFAVGRPVDGVGGALAQGAQLARGEVVAEDAQRVGVAVGQRQHGDSVALRGADEGRRACARPGLIAADLEEFFALLRAALVALGAHDGAAAAGARRGVEQPVAVDRPERRAEAGAGAEQLPLAVVRGQIEQLQLRAAMHQHRASVLRPGEIERRAVDQPSRLHAAAARDEAGGQSVAHVADHRQHAAAGRPVDVVREAGRDDLAGVGGVGVDRLGFALSERHAPQLEARIILPVRAGADRDRLSVGRPGRPHEEQPLALHRQARLGRLRAVCRDAREGEAGVFRDECEGAVGGHLLAAQSGLRDWAAGRPAGRLARPACASS